MELNGQLHTQAILAPSKDFTNFNKWEANWISELIRTLLGTEEILAPAENRAAITWSPSLYPSYTVWVRRLSWQNACRVLVMFSVAPQLSWGCFQSVRCLAANGTHQLLAYADDVNHLTSNDDYSGRTAPLTPKRCILYIYSTNIDTDYFKHGIHSPFFPLQNAVCFINLTYLVPVLFTFYIQGVLKLKK